MIFENIIIGGGGKSPTMEKLFLDKIRVGGRLLLCPMASENLVMTLSARRKWIKKLRPDIAMDFLLDGNVDLNDYDGLMITGGSTCKLMDALHENNLIGQLNAFRESGKTIYGASAGAIVMGRDINIDPETLSVADSAGLDWLEKSPGGGICVATHWPDYEEIYVRKFSNEHKYRTICCPEHQGAIFDANGNLVRLIGDGVEFIN